MKVKELVMHLSRLNPEGEIYIDNGAGYCDIKIRNYPKEFLDTENALDMYYLQPNERNSDCE